MVEPAGEGKDPREDCEHGDIEYVDEDMAKALAHPLRVQILAELNKRVMSPSAFSECFDMKLQNVSYHFRALQKYGCIEEVETRPVRGAVEHFYRATKRVLFDGKAWEDMPPSIKAEISARAVSDFLEAIAAAMRAETFDSSDERVAVWLQQRLDEQGWGRCGRRPLGVDPQHGSHLQRVNPSPGRSRGTGWRDAGHLRPVPLRVAPTKARPTRGQGRRVRLPPLRRVPSCVDRRDLHRSLEAMLSGLRSDPPDAFAEDWQETMEEVKRLLGEVEAGGF
jgi:DNA-binding transcriptional ArsR family regulator